MPLATLDRTPPPFFRQGPTAATRLVFCTALAIFLMVADARFAVVSTVRAGIATVLLPFQRLAALPVEVLLGARQYVQGLQTAQQGERQAREALSGLTLRAQRAEQLAAENARLRALLELKSALAVRSAAAEVLYESADPFSRKLVIARGEFPGLVLGAPVINEAGVLGQVTRLFPFTAEITLLADKDAAIPVLNARTQVRGAAFGGLAGGLMELRFTSANADIQPGDVMLTSGLDGVYPPGMKVASVTAIDRRAETGFARITLRPAASGDDVRFVLVLEPVSAQLPPKPAPAAEVAPAAPGKDRPGKAAVRKASAP
jgi:rod shape-determining protein MreC